MASSDLRKALQKKTWATLMVVMMLSLLLFLLASGSNMRWDLSDNQTSSLSDSTRTLLTSLDEPLQIKAYFTKDLPQPYGQLQQFIVDKLQSYRDAGKGNVGYEVIDPADDPNAEAALNALQIPKVQVQVVEDDRAQVRQGYLAVVVEYLDRQELLPVIQTDVGFEYMLTRKIKKISGKGKQKVALATGFGAKSMQKLQVLTQLLQGEYELVEVSLTSEDIPEDVSVLVIDALQRSPSKTFRYRVDQFRMRGGGVFVLAGNAIPDLEQGFVVVPIDAVANQWLHDDLGVSVEPGLVMDQQASRVTVNQQQQGFMFRSAVDYPFIANVTDLHSEQSVVAGLDAVAFPFASPLLWIDSEQSKTTLLRSSAWSSVQAGPPFDVNPLLSMQERFAGMSIRSSDLLLLQQGKMDSAFERGAEEASQAHVPSTEDGRLLVSGSAALLDNEFIEGNNSVLILNAIDWLSKDEALIALRSQGVTQRPLEPLDSGARTFFKLLWIFAAPLLLLMFGFWRWLDLRKRRT